MALRARVRETSGKKPFLIEDGPGRLVSPILPIPAAYTCQCGYAHSVFPVAMYSLRLTTTDDQPSEMMDWFCVQIDHPRIRVKRAMDITFRNMLRGEYLSLGDRDNIKVYRKSFGQWTDCYFFSPGASESLKIFIDFWDGIPVKEPADLSDLEQIF